MSLIKELFCKHEYETVTNLYGDLINHFDGARSIKMCPKCGKFIYLKKLDPNCKKVNEIF